MRDRHNDLLWRVRLDNDHWIYLYLLLEFQSTDDYWMAIRLMTYIGLLYQDLARQRVVLPGQPLPPVFPIVLCQTRGPRNSGASSCSTANGCRVS
ncbi:Rpn family recombination-promoting nuclease/putative transposase, partial [Pseudomonas aeruginosa]|uniref:Rpn family recombination-promoting nuclease/putative transposase n=1 Tax=Pseudomonas aeruginosa TaxID=287 RepID=UPI003D18E2CC